MFGFVRLAMSCRLLVAEIVVEGCWFNNEEGGREGSVVKWPGREVIDVDTGKVVILCESEICGTAFGGTSVDGMECFGEFCGIELGGIKDGCIEIEGWSIEFDNEVGTCIAWGACGRSV